MAPMNNDDEDDLKRSHYNIDNINNNIINNNNNKNSDSHTHSYYNSYSKRKSNGNANEAKNNVNKSYYVMNQHLAYEQNPNGRPGKGSDPMKGKIYQPNKRPIANYGAADIRKSAKTSIPYQRRTSRGANDANDDPEANDHQIGVADIVGSFGWFQLLLLLFSGLREGLVGYDALVMSIILQPESRFVCADNLRASLNDPMISQKGQMNLANFSQLFPGQIDRREADFLNETVQCYRSTDGGQSFLIDPETSQPLRCNSWIFSNESLRAEGPSLVAEWSLVCQYHWLVAFIESAYFFGLVTGNLVWGYYADKVGRRPAYLAAHTISLVFGSLAVVSPTIYTFAFCRFLSAFGSIGYNIIYSIQVELIGVKHRSFSTILNHLGWGLGVICVPLVDHIFDDYRPIIAVAPVFTLLMFPWAFWLPESSRWLMANGKYKDARLELIRAARFNGKVMTSQLEKKISALEQRIREDKLRQQASNGQVLIIGNHDDDEPSLQKQQQQQQAHQQKEPTNVGSYRVIFGNKILLRDTIILSYAAFVGHLFYYVQTINFAYVKNLSTAANFITSGAGEWVSVVVGAILLRLFSRKTCMSIFLLFMTGSFAFQSFIDSGIMPGLDSKLIITANNGVGTLASLLLVFITLIVNQEVYPTVVRQTGTSLTNTLGESGSTLAPLVIQFSRIIGSWRANIIYSIFCIAGMLLSQFVTKTDDIELPDNYPT